MGETSVIAENVSKAVQEYIAWQGDKIGRDINPDKLRNLLLNAGASRVTMTNPTYTQIGVGEIASLTGTPSITQEYDE
jgi:phage-related baseplate assembly protein